MVSVDCTVKQYRSRAIDQKHVRTAEFLRQSVVARDIVGRYGHLSFLTKSELSCVIDYLAKFLVYLFCHFFVPRVRFHYK